jgi:hypothetical protein
MRRFTLLTICLLALASLMVTTTWAQSPHYLKSDASIDSSTACYDVALKEAGLGNSGFSSLTYTLQCSASYTTACVTGHKHNIVQGQPKSGTTTASTEVSLDIRNGQTNGTVSLCPVAENLPDPGCTGSQLEVILAASYSGCSLSDSLGTASPSLSDLSATNLFIIVQ